MRDYDGKYYYAKINGNISKAYDYVYIFRYTENGKYAYSYQENGNYAYYYKENDKYYVNINGNISKAYDDFSDLSLTDNGYYTYYYTKDDQTYINENGKIEPYNNIVDYVFYTSYDNDTELYNLDKQHSFYSDYKYDYVVIDGAAIGKSPALSGWYDKQQNAFIWNAIEGKELVVYEYKLD